VPKRQLPETPARQETRVPFEIRNLDRRAAADDSGDVAVFEGYASVFGHEYLVAGGPPYGWVERIAQGAFTESLSADPDVVFLVNHEGLPLARTKSGTLTLEEDKTGLGVRAELDLNDPDVARLVPKIERGDLDEMSFAFRVTSQRWFEHDDWEGDDQSGREIDGANLHRGDVSTVTFGANDATVGELVANALRSGKLSEGDLEEMIARHARRDAGATEAEEVDAGTGVPVHVALAGFDF